MMELPANQKTAHLVDQNGRHRIISPWFLLGRLLYPAIMGNV